MITGADTHDDVINLFENNLDPDIADALSGTT